MNTLLLVGKDSTARRVAQLPSWAQLLHNSDVVPVDHRNVAHRPDSPCTERHSTVRTTTLVKAMFSATLCLNCPATLTAARALAGVA